MAKALALCRVVESNSQRRVTFSLKGMPVTSLSLSFSPLDLVFVFVLKNLSLFDLPSWRRLQASKFPFQPILFYSVESSSSDDKGLDEVARVLAQSTLEGDKVQCPPFPLGDIGLRLVDIHINKF